MGVSATGQGWTTSALWKGVATAGVVLALFYVLYGPPFTKLMSEAAHEECNRLTGGSYRGYVLEWQTTTYQSIHVPHWQCTRIGGDRETTNLGWWVGL